MENNIDTLSLEEAGVSLIDCVHKTPPAQETGKLYIAIPQLSDGRIKTKEARRISQEDFEEWTKKASPKAYDVVLSRRCNPGETAYVPPDLSFAVGQNLVLLRSDGTRVFPPFLRWLVRTPQWWGQVGKFINVGAVFTSLKCRDVPKFELPIPSIPEQERLAHILGTLDDKIELNRRINQTLEGMAQAIFKSWFVDFEPVKAKAIAKAAGATPEEITRAAMAAIAGKTGSELDQLSEPQQRSLAQTAALFPDSLQHSELGEIPERWEVSTIGEETETVGGATPSTKNPEFWNDGEYHWVTPKDFSSLQDKVLLSSSRKITDKGLEKINSGLLPEGTVLMSSRAPVGYLAISRIETAINQGFIAMKCNNRLSAEYVIQWANSEMDNIKQAASGSTFAEISKKTFRPFPVIVPTIEIVDEYSRIVRSLYDQIALNGQESETLTELRDTLIPKLLSGGQKLEGGKDE